MIKLSALSFLLTLDLAFGQILGPVPRPGPLPASRGPARQVYSPPVNTLEDDRYAPPGPYNFGFDIKDEYGNHHYRKEESDGKGSIQGSYGYADAAGLYRFVQYLADRAGFKANIKSNEPGMANSNPADVSLAIEGAPRGVLQAASAINPAAPVLPDTPRDVSDVSLDRGIDRTPERGIDRTSDRVRGPASFYQWNDNKASEGDLPIYAPASYSTNPNSTLS